MPKCAECSTCFKPRQITQLFCKPACQQAYHNRMKKRGGRLVPLAMACRENRNTETAKWAHTEWCALVSQFRAEDKAAGRMSAHELIRVQRAVGTRG